MTAVRKPEAGTEDSMITCKLCNTRLSHKHVRRDGSMLCPVCGQIYWKAAVERAISESGFPENSRHTADEIRREYWAESRRSTERIRANFA
jgi:uncharacterized Zn finger protein (UPF0148 family)